MKNIVFAIGSILIVSVVVLGGCQKKEPAAEPQSPEAEKAALQAADACQEEDLEMARRVQPKILKSNLTDPKLTHSGREMA